MRERVAEPELAGSDLRDTPAPKHLDAPLTALWDELRDTLHARVSGWHDAIAFEALVRLVALMRSGDAVAADYARLQAYLGEFGMTPASRSKVAQGARDGSPKGFAALRTVPPNDPSSSTE